MAKTLMGMAEIFSQWPNGQMWTGSGPRSETKPFTFPAGSFTKPPQVVASISGLDCSHDHNTRVNVTVLNVTKNGFSVKVDTWADTQLAMVSIAWVAHQP
jgi:hypothetical protein